MRSLAERVTSGQFVYMTELVASGLKREAQVLEIASKLAMIPEIAGGAGHGISLSGEIDRKWTYKGHRYSYVNARCETGHLQARVEVTFKDKTFLTGTFVKPCTVRRG